MLLICNFDSMQWITKWHKDENGIMYYKINICSWFKRYLAKIV